MKNEFGETLLHDFHHNHHIGVRLYYNDTFPDSLRMEGHNARVTEAMARDIIAALKDWLDTRKQRETERKRKELTARLETLKGKYRELHSDRIYKEHESCFAHGNSVIDRLSGRSFGRTDWDNLVSDINAIDALEKERRSIAAELEALDA